MSLIVALILVSHKASASIWIPNENSDSISEFQGILKSGSTPAHRVISSADLDGSSRIAFDHQGNLWETNFNANSIVEFTRAQINALKANSAPTALVVIREDSGNNLNGPEGLAFDGAGNLWVGSENERVILMYKPSQLTASGNPTPDVILNGSSFSFSSPSLPVFDHAGNLWVVDEDLPNGVGGTGEVFKYSKAQITELSSGFQNTDPVFGFGYAAFGELEGFAFDPAGNIWVADENSSLVYKFRTSQINRSELFRSMTPAVVLSPTPITDGSSCTQSIQSPYGLAVDELGNLYIENEGNFGPPCFGSLARFSPASITRSGSPKPQVFISSDSTGTNLNAPNYLTLSPTTIP